MHFLQRLARYQQRPGADRGSSEVISFLFLLPLVIGIMFTTIDASVYFTNRASMNSFARDGARSVATMGGDGTATQATAIENAYGSKRSTVCADLDSPKVQKAVRGDLSNIECGVLNNIANASTLVNVEVLAVKCSPEKASYITQRTMCQLDWRYNSIPASGLTLIKKAPSANQASTFGDTNGLVAVNTTIGTSESEVNLSGINLVPRV